MPKKHLATFEFPELLKNVFFSFQPIFLEFLIDHFQLF